MRIMFTIIIGMIIALPCDMAFDMSCGRTGYGMIVKIK